MSIYQNVTVHAVQIVSISLKGNLVLWKLHPTAIYIQYNNNRFMLLVARVCMNRPHH